MLFKNWLCRLAKSFRHSKMARNASRRRNPIEALESRLLLAGVWDGGAAADDWNDPLNWDNDQLPGAADNVVIGATFSGITITSSNNVTINSLSSEASLAVSGGTFTISSNSTINNSVNVSGVGVLTLDTLTLGGTGTLTNAATVNLLGSTINTALDTRSGRVVAQATGGASAINDSITTNSSSTIRIEGNASVGPATLAVANGFTNKGLIVLTSINGSGQSAILNVTNGMLINEGETRVQAGTGGARTISADLTNDGVVNFNVNTTLSKTNGVFTNNANVNIAAGANLTFGTSSIFTQAAGTLAISDNGTTNTTADDGTFTMSADRFNFDGGAITGIPLLDGSTLNLGAATSPVQFTTRGGSTLIGGLKADQTILVESVNNTPASLTSASDFTNAGTITLKTLSSSGASDLLVTNGTLTIAATGKINAEPGSGGSRTISAQIDNQGAINVNHNLGITNSSRTFTSSGGTLNVAGGKLLTVTNGSTVLGAGTVLPGTGTIDLAGTHTVNLTSDLTLPSAGSGLTMTGTVTVNGPGTLINQLAGPVALELSGDVINAALSNQGLLLVNNGASALNGAVTTNANSIIRVQSANNSAATLTSASGFTNAGTITLQTLSSSGSSDLTVTSGTLLNSATGIINANPGTGGSRTISANLTNDGVVNFNVSTTLSKTNGVFTNNANTNIAAGANLTFGTSSIFTQAAGTLAISDNGTTNTTTDDGTFTMSVDRFNFDGGAITGIPVLDASTLNLGAATSAVKFTTRGGSTLIGDLKANQTILVESVNNTPASLTSAAGFTNAGTITLKTLSSSGPSDLLVTSGTLTNAATGVINAETGSGGSRTISADLMNNGLVNFNVSTTLGKSSGVFTNNANVNIAASANLTFGTSSIFTQAAGTLVISDNGTTNTTADDGTFTMSADRFNFDGGAITGIPLLDGSTLNLGAATSPAQFTTRGGSTLLGDLKANQTILVESVNNTPASLTSAADFTNAGTITLKTLSSSGPSDLLVTNGTLTNAATGVINAEPGSGGSRTISAQIDNQGAINVNATTTLGRSGADHINAGTINVSGGNLTVNQTGTTPTFTNSGTLNIASGRSFEISGGPLTNFSGTTLTGGTYFVAGTLKFPNAAITTNAANIVLDGAGSIVNGSNDNALVNFATNAATGSFTIQNGRNFTTASTITEFSNAGQLTIGSGTNFTVSNGKKFTQTGGTTTDNGTLTTTHSTGVDLQGGVLQGNGDVVGNVRNAGQIKPGTSPGGLDITGNYTQTSAGALNIEVGGTTAVSGFDQLNVTGTASLAGTLSLSTVNAFVPSASDSFQVMTFASRTGDFGTTTGKSISGTLEFTPTFNAAGLLLEVDGVAANASPVITSSATANVAENSTAVLTATATDADLPAQTITFSIVGGADAAKFAITSGGVLTFQAAPDFESPTDAGTNNIYNVTIQASDGNGGATTQDIAVTVTPVNDNSPVFTSSATASVTEGATAVKTVTATDADLPAQTVTFSISGGADQTKFSITSGGVLTFQTAPDFDSPTDSGMDNVYNVTIEASDGNGRTTTQDIAVTVTAAAAGNSNPVITSSATANVAENSTAVLSATATDADSPAQTISFSISGGADAAKFSITSGGVLTFLAAPDFETPTDAGVNNVYNVTVQASDGAGGVTAQDVTVTVTDVNETVVAGTTLVVDTLSDAEGGGADTSSIAALLANKGADGKISLREAILAANNTPGADTITFHGNLTSGGQAVIRLNGSQLSITSDLIITGPGAELLTISGDSDSDGSGNSRILIVSDADAGFRRTVSISGLSFTLGNGFGTASGNGGAIFNAENLTLRNAAIFGNFSEFSGGGIANTGSLAVLDSSIFTNEATSSGGGISNTGTLTLVNSSVFENFASAHGGGLQNFGGIATLTNSTLAANSSIDTGGGIFNGGFNGGTVQLRNTIVAGNFQSSTDSDIVNDGIDSPATVSGSNNLIGNAETSGGLGHGVNGNIVGNAGSGTIDAGVGFPGDLEQGLLPEPRLLSGSPAINAGAALATLSTAVTDVLATSIEVTDTTFIALGVLIRIDSEILLVTSKSGNTLTVARGQNSTTAATHSVGVGITLAFDQRGLARNVGTVDIGAAEAQPLHLTVTTLEGFDDEDYSAGDLSLREALAVAENNDDGGPIVISFDPNLTNELAAGTSAKIQLTSQLIVRQSLTITGPGADLLSIETATIGQSGNRTQHRIILVDDARSNTKQDVTIAGVTLSHGRADFTQNGALFGGAILNRENVTLSGVEISDNLGGGIRNSGGTLTIKDGSSVTGNGGGAGIMNVDGTVVLVDSNVSDNGDAPVDPSVGISTLRGTLTVTRSTISGNDGGIDSDFSEVAILDSTVSRNRPLDEFSGFGGIGADNSTLTVTNSTISDNQAGGVFIENSVVNIANSTIANNTGGAGIFSIDGSLTVTGSRISGNTSLGTGGVVSAGSTTTISNSTLSDNHGGSEGGIANIQGSMTVVNSTIVGNSTSGGTVGGILNDRGLLSLFNSTISGNSATQSGQAGGIYSNGTEAITNLHNTIVAGNYRGTSAGDVVNGGSDGTGLLNGSNNLIGDAATSAGLVHGVEGNIVGNSGSGTINLATVLETFNDGDVIKPLLANNGGSKQTVKLIAGSPAIDAGNNAALPVDEFDLDGDTNLTEPVPFDQRGNGFARVVNSLVDIGALEFSTPPNQNPVFTSGVSVSVAENSTSVLTATATDADEPAQTVTFSISGGADAAKFAITSGGVLTFNAAPDFENPTDAGTNNVYNVTIQASDGNGGLTTQDIAVTVTDVVAEGADTFLIAAVSVDQQAGAPVTGNGFSSNATVSADGRYVAFISDARNLVANQQDTVSTPDVFLYDRTTATTRLLTGSLGSATKTGTNPEARGNVNLRLNAVVSADGKFVAFTSRANDLISGQLESGTGIGDNSGFLDLFLYDVTNQTTKLISHSRTDAHLPGADGDVFGLPSISADGRFVTFLSNQTDLVTGVTTNGTRQVYLYDRGDGQTPESLVLVSHTTESVTTAGSAVGATDPVVSADGRFVAFASFAPNMVPGQQQIGNFNYGQVYLYDRLSPTGTILVSGVAGSATLTSNFGAFGQLAISAHGRLVAFVSGSGNLVSGQIPNGGWDDIFVFDRDVSDPANRIRLVSHKFNSDVTESDVGFQLVQESASRPVINVDLANATDDPNGLFIAYLSYGSQIVEGLPANERSTQDLFLYSVGTGANVLVSHAAGAASTPANASLLNNPIFPGRFPWISSDGRFVAYEHVATNLVLNQVDTTNTSNVFLYDRLQNTNALVDGASGSANQVGNSNGSRASIVNGISGDGSVVVFSSSSSNLVADDSNLAEDVFVRVRQTTTDIEDPVEFIVDTLSDSDTGANTSSIEALLANKGADGKISLREAIVAANNTPGADTITFHASLTDGGPGVIRLNGTELVISSDLTISGPTGNFGLSISADRDNDESGNSRVFRVDDGIAGTNAIVTISDLGILRGQLPEFEDGAGILNHENLTVLRCVIGNNSTDSTSGYGGGIANTGTLTVMDSEISFNSANREGGGIDNNGGTVTVSSNSFIFSNQANNQGGGINNRAGSFTITNSDIQQNGLGLGSGAGVAVTSGTMTIVGTTISDNHGDSNGGGILALSGTLTVTNSTITANTTESAGGGIYVAFATATVTNSAIFGNDAASGGGGISVSSSSGTLTVINSTIANNEAIFGGGIRNAGTTTMVNTTLVGNTATSSGGGIFDDGTMSLRNTLVAGNLRSGIPNAIAVSGSGTLTGSNNLIDNASTSGGLTNGISGNVVGVSGANTIPLTSILETSNDSGVVRPILASNGGPTMTAKLISGSPAINKGNNSNLPADSLDLDGDANVAETLPVDQRGAGFDRVIGSAVDIGAFEADLPLNTPPTVTNDIADQSALEDTAFQFQFATDTFNDADVGDSLTFTATRADGSALPAWLIFTAATRTFAGTPTDSDSGAFDVKVTATDTNSETANDTFTITVAAVNDAPSFNKGSNLVASGDGTAKTFLGWATNISSGPASESQQTIDFQVATSNGALFNVTPAVSPDGTLTFTPKPGATGTTTVTVRAHDNGGFSNGGFDTSAPQTFTITLTGVNKAPSFTKGANQTVLEDAAAQTVNWATNISAGSGETTQQVSFVVTNNNATLFSVAPAISSTGVLTFTPAPNASGSATISVVARDDGGIAGGGKDSSAAQTFTITLTPVNDLPTISAVADQTTNEDVATGAIAISVGDVETAAASLKVTAASSNTSLVPAANVVLGGTGANRTVVVRPAANLFGSATITLTVTDANNGISTRSFLVTVNSVNDAPTIADIVNQATDEDKATAVLNVTINDLEDSLNALVVTATSSNTTLVTNDSDHIQLGGSLGKRTLKVTPLPNQFGTTTITVTVTDSQGVSSSDSFVLTVKPVNDAPVVTSATFNVGEYTTKGAVLGTVTVTDADPGDTVSAFAITGGNTGNAFAIDAAGRIVVNDATKIDFEQIAQYALTVKATDNNQGLGTGTKAFATNTVTVNIADQSFDLMVPSVDVANTITVLKVANEFVVRRNGTALDFGVAPRLTPNTPRNIELEDVSSLTIDGGTEADTVLLDASLNSLGTPVSHKFTGLIIFNGNEGNDVLNASAINGNLMELWFDGGAGNDVAQAGAEADLLVGGDGNDTLNGGIGNDLLEGGAGDDALSGGKGDDQYLFDVAATAETDTLTELRDEGSDLLDFSTLAEGVIINLSSEIALASHGNRTIKTSATGNVTQAGNFEHAIGGSGNDSITGNATANRLFGNEGNDTLHGGAGNDILDGGSGNDFVFGENGHDQLSGGLGDDVLSGNAGNDKINGGAGRDTLLGGSGGDLLSGGSDNDLIFGEEGNDTLTGGLGEDSLSGGSGMNRMTDFIPASDVAAAFSSEFDEIQLLLAALP